MKARQTKVNRMIDKAWIRYADKERGSYDSALTLGDVGRYTVEYDGVGLPIMGSVSFENINTENTGG